MKYNMLCFGTIQYLTKTVIWGSEWVKKELQSATWIILLPVLVV